MEGAADKGKVCVTGASGYIASWLIKRLLESGYRVVGTVRNPGDHRKLAHLWKLEGAEERLELVKADLLEEGSFDIAVAGCKGVFHTASPVFGKDTISKEEFLGPAIKGTLNVLKSCTKNPSLKRVVLTSSTSTIRVRDDIPHGSAINEDSWSSVEVCEKLEVWYPLAKMMAEKAALAFAAENNIDLVTIIPSFVVGPSLPPDLSLTASDVLALFKGKTTVAAMQDRMGYVHIDDIVRCHILVFEHPDAKGRYLCSSTVLDGNELLAFLIERYPQFPVPTRFEKRYATQCYSMDTSKIQKLGMKFRGLEEMFDDAVQSLKEQGYLQEK